MTPIVEAYLDLRIRSSGRPRLMLICRSPEHGAILRRRQVRVDDPVVVAGVTAEFVLWASRWYRPQGLVSRCEEVLL